jgi:hypothetical protein
MMAVQNAYSVMNGIGAKVLMMAKIARMIETTNTIVVGADKFMSNLPLVDEWTVIVFCEKASAVG